MKVRQWRTLRLLQCATTCWLRIFSIVFTSACLIANSPKSKGQRSSQPGFASVILQATRRNGHLLGARERLRAVELSGMNLTTTGHRHLPPGPAYLPA